MLRVATSKAKIGAKSARLILILFLLLHVRNEEEDEAHRPG
jgi:hypothetical protein